MRSSSVAHVARWLRPAARVCAFLAVLAVSITGSSALADPAAPSQFVGDTQGNLVTLTWAAPAGPTPELYILEGGMSPGEVLGSLPISASVNTVTLPGPTGVFYLRMHAVLGGIRSAASNEIQVFVNVAPPPDPPTDVLSMTVGADVVLSWKNPAGPLNSVLLEVTGPLTGSAWIAPTGSLRVSGVPDGTYTLSLRGSNSTGIGAPSLAVTFTLPGGAMNIVKAPAQLATAPRLPVRLEHMTTPRLGELLQREGLAAVIAPAATQFDAILALKNWTAAQFPHGDPTPYPPWDALTVLDWIRAGITGGFCGQYSQVLLQSLAAVGIPARYVELGTVDNPYSHYVVEAWSNDLNKWVVMDGDYNIHFERDGVPQSALEVHDLLLAGEADQLVAVPGAFRDGHPSPASWPLGTAEHYYYVRFHLNANQMTAPAEAPFDRFNDMIEWSDPRVAPWEDSLVTSDYPKELLTSRRTSDRALVDAGVNQVWATPRPGGPGVIAVDLIHNVVDIQRFDYRIIDENGAAGPWIPNGSTTILWALSPTDRTLEVRGVNVRGIAGPTSAVGVPPQ